MLLVRTVEGEHPEWFIEPSKNAYFHVLGAVPEKYIPQNIA
jgi:hypothetical protein